MADKPFRVLLDLTDLHIENFKYVWISVSPRELKTISDFKKSVLHKISLEREDIKLFVRDGLLLEEETIIVLREDDTVKVQYEGQFPFHIHIENSEKESEKSRKRNYSETNVSDMPSNSKRYKTGIDILSYKRNESDSEETKNKKRKKLKKSHLLILDSENGHSAILEQTNPINEKSCKKKEKKKSSVTSDHSVTDVNFNGNEDTFFSFNTGSSPKHSKNNASSKSVILSIDNVIDLTNDSVSKDNDFSCHQSKKINLSESSKVNTEDIKSEGLNNNCPKKKRKRRRKRKQTSESMIVNIADANSNIKPFSNSIVEDVNRKQSSFSSQSKIQEDCYFDDASQLPTVSTNTFVKEDKSAVAPQSSNNYPKISTPAQSDGCGNPNWHVSLTQTRNSVDCNGHSSSTNRSVTHELVAKMDVSPISDKNTPKKKYADFLAFNSLPKLKTHSACKNGLSSSESSPVLCDKPVATNSSFQSTKENKNAPGKQYADLPALDSLPKMEVHSAFKNGSSSDESRSVVHDKIIAKKTMSFQSSGKNKNYLDLPALNSLPKVGTHIAYKTLELDENYSPVITDYREGIVKSINPDNEEIEIELYKELIKPGRTGKFENLLEDEIPPPEIKTYDVLRWSSIISPKHLS